MRISDTRGKILYVSCHAGIAGDMFLASLIEITEGEGYLRNELAKLPLAGYELGIFRDVRGGISGVRFDVKTDEKHSHRNLGDIKQIISASGLSERVRIEAARAFVLLAEAEAKVHGVGIEDVHFHEVGAVDSIIDITGAMIMLERLGWPEVVFTPLNIGSGTVKCAHGVLPVPAPAVAELLTGLIIYSQGEPMERITPTGAAIVRALGANISTSIPAGKIEKTGSGLGAKESTLPNALRTMLIERAAATPYNLEECVEICANIDDMSPEDLSAVMERLFDEGALDVWFEHIQMKKNRPAAKLCCLASIPSETRLAEIILRETTSLGVRTRSDKRYVLDRRIDTFDTPLGAVRVKSAISQGKIVKQMPEFEDILRLSKKHGMSVMTIREILASLEFVPESGDKTDDDKEEIENFRGHNHRCGHCHDHLTDDEGGLQDDDTSGRSSSLR